MRLSYLAFVALTALLVCPLVAAEGAPSLSFNNLTVSPLAVSAGTPVVVSVNVRNDGSAGSSEVSLQVNGVMAQNKSVTLGAGEAVTIAFEVGTNSYAGDVEVKIDSQTGIFTVLLQPLPTSSVAFGNFSVNPKEVSPGDPVIVTIDVRNTGGVSGLYSFQATLDGVPRTSKTGELLPGEKQRVSFTLTSGEPGTHSVEAAGYSATFTVIKLFSIGDYALPILVVAEAFIIVFVVAIIVKRRKSSSVKGTI